MEGNKRLNILVVVLLVVVGMLVYQNNKFKSEMRSMHHYMSNVENNIRMELQHSNYNLISRLETLLDEQQSSIADYKATYQKVDTEAGTVNTLIEFTLKQTVAASKVYLRLATHNGGHDRDQECSSLNGLNFSCEVDLSYKNDYILDMYQKSDNGDMKSLNYKPYYQNVKNEFDDRIRHMGGGISTDREQVHYFFQLQNNTFGEDAFKIKTVVVKGYYGEKEVFTEDITNKNIMNGEERNKLYTMIAAGEMDVVTDLDFKYGAIVTNENGVEYGDYFESFLHSDAGIAVEDNSFPEYTFKVIVTLNNGDVHELY